MSLSVAGIALIGSLLAEAFLQGHKLAELLEEAKKNPEVSDEIWAGIAAEAKEVGEKWDSS